MLKFEPVAKFEKGTTYNLLLKSYESILNEMPKDKADALIRKWKDQEEETFEHLNTIGKCCFITTLEDGKIVGSFSYDPRQWPELGIIGDNVVLPEFRGKGYGKAQISEILRIFKENGVKKAIVSTGNNLFFIPAQKQYQSCGFKETRKFMGDDFEQIEYELEL